jgi:hypothetical protein
MGRVIEGRFGHKRRFCQSRLTNYVGEGPPCGWSMPLSMHLICGARSVGESPAKLIT